MKMEIKLRKNSSIYIIDITGEMDLYNSHTLKEIVERMIQKNIKHYVINLEQVNYIDSTGIGALIHVFSAIKKANMHMKIANIHGTVKRVIELTKLVGYLPIVNSVEDAVNQLKQEAQKESSA